MQPTIEQVLGWTKEAGEIARKMQGGNLDVRYKAAADIVTAADTAVEDFLVSKIHAEFPDHSINAEESGEQELAADHTWYIDPIDGTLNYAHGLPQYCISVAYAYQGQLQLGVVYSPPIDEAFWAVKGGGAYLNGEKIEVSSVELLRDSMLITGFRNYLLDTPRSNIDNFVRLSREVQTIRRLGSAALDIVYVACGRVEAFWEIDLNPWDVAAGILIVREAGGIVEGLYGDSDLLTGKVDILAANPHIFPQMRSILLEERNKAGIDASQA